MNPFSRRAVLVAAVTFVFFASSFAAPAETVIDYGMAYYGHPATYPHGITETTLVASDCASNPYQSLDGWVFELRKGKKNYSIATTGDFRIDSMHMVFYDETATGCVYREGHWYVDLQATNQKFPINPLPRWLVISFPAARDVSITLWSW